MGAGAPAPGLEIVPSGSMHAVATNEPETLCGLNIEDRNMPVWDYTFGEVNADHRCRGCAELAGGTK